MRFPLVVGGEIATRGRGSPGFELRGEFCIVDGKVDDVEIDVEAGGLQRVDDLGRIAVAGLLAVGYEHDDGAARAAEVAFNRRQRIGDRRAREVHRLDAGDLRGRGVGFQRRERYLEVATAELFPKIVINGNAGFRSLQTDNLFDATSQISALGLSISWHLFDAERSMRNAEDAYVRTHTQAATDLVALFKVLGGGWDAGAQAG